MSRVLFIQADSRTLNPTLEQAAIEAEYAADPSVARAEWGGEFRDDIREYLSDELLDACAPGRLARGSRRASVAFVDVSGGVHDASALAIAHAELLEGSTVPIAVLDHMQVRDAPHEPDAVVEEFARTLKMFGLARVTGDRYAGLWPAGAFNRHGITYQASELDKSAIYNELVPAFAARRVELLEDRRLLTELRLLERRTRSGGRLDAIDHPPGAYDDVANAAAGALSHALKESAAGQWASGYFARAALLVEGEPVRPDPVARILKPWITVATSESQTSSLGAVFWAYSDLYGIQAVPLIALDYSIADIDALGQGWPAYLYRHADKLRSKWRAVSPETLILVEDPYLHNVLQVTLPEALGCNLQLVEGEDWARTLAERAKRIRSAVNLGEIVKFGEDAFKREVTHQGNTATHLWNQVNGYEPRNVDAPAELFAAFALGVQFALKTGIQVAGATQGDWTTVD